MGNLDAKFEEVGLTPVESFYNLQRDAKRIGEFLTGLPQYAEAWRRVREARAFTNKNPFVEFPAPPGDRPRSQGGGYRQHTAQGSPALLSRVSREGD